MISVVYILHIFAKNDGETKDSEHSCGISNPWWQRNTDPCLMSGISDFHSWDFQISGCSRINVPSILVPTFCSFSNPWWQSNADPCLRAKVQNMLSLSLYSLNCFGQKQMLNLDKYVILARILQIFKTRWLCISIYDMMYNIKLTKKKIHNTFPM